MDCDIEVENTMAGAIKHTWFVCSALILYFTCIRTENNPCDNFAISGCTCAWSEVIPLITCSNDTNLSRLPVLLDSAFDVNETYEIAFEDFPALPARVIDGLIVFRLTIDNPEFTNVSEEAFDGAIRLRWFHVYRSSLCKIPNFGKVAHFLRSVNIDNSMLTKVEGEFQNMSRLSSLSLSNNTIEYISENALRGTTAIVYLDLSFNRIVSLPPRIFYGLNSIRKLALSYNRLHTLDGLFDDLGPKLKFLRLEFNNFTDVDVSLHDHLSGLVSLSLSSNPLKGITVNTFKKSWTNLHSVYLDRCNLTEFEADYFRHLERLHILDLSYNQIMYVVSSYLNFGQDVDLILSGNHIESFGGKITSRTKRLIYTDSNIRRLGTLLQYTQLSDVDLSRNRLIALEAWNFKGSQNAENLAFRSNQIKKVDYKCFNTFRSTLYTLDLSSNRLTSLNRSIQHLYRLSVLNVSYNFLETLNNDEFAGCLIELSNLYMQHNKILFLGGQIHLVPNLQYLILRNNSISHLDIAQIPRTLKYLDIDGNPFKCDCRFYLQFLRNLDGTLELDSAPCTSSYLPADFYEPCPSPCTCKCKFDVNVSFVGVDCSSQLFTRVPSALSDWSLFPSPPGGVYRIDVPYFTIYDNTLSVKLSNNGIRSLKGVNLSPNLKELFLDRNLLTSLPYWIMNLTTLRKVTLSENPWTCDCDDGKAVEFRKWMIYKNSSILDVSQTRCGNSSQNKNLVGRIIIAATEADLCPSKIALYITIGFALLGLLLLAAGLKITYTRFEMNIKVWLYSKGITWVKEKDIDKDKTFDAFLSFSHADLDFVIKEIINEIEMRSPNINLCLHYRHFVPGKFIHENIINAVNGSKRTVLVLSKNFLDSEWCMMEFRAADVQNIKDKVRRVIVIKVGDLPSNMDPSIKVYLESTSYLTWGEKYFWQKFLYALPQPTAHAPTA